MQHLFLTKDEASQFHDIQYVCIGGSNERMETFAKQVAETLGIKEVQSVGQHKRYVIYKVGNVLLASHGMGAPSISILLNELAKLLKYAKAGKSTWIRMGTCGGVGLEAGTVAISSASLNGALQPYHETYVLAEPVRRHAIFDADLNNELK